MNLCSWAQFSGERISFLTKVISCLKCRQKKCRVKKWFKVIVSAEFLQAKWNKQADRIWDFVLDLMHYNGKEFRSSTGSREGCWRRIWKAVQDRLLQILLKMRLPSCNQGCCEKHCSHCNSSPILFGNGASLTRINGTTRVFYSCHT